MGDSIATSRQSDPVRSLDNIRTVQVKAGLASDRIGQMNTVKGDAVIEFFGSVKSAALELGVDPSQMRREFKAGDFERVGRHKDVDAILAAMSAAMHDHYGHMAATPEARARQSAMAALDALKDLLQYIEHNDRKRESA